MNAGCRNNPEINLRDFAMFQYARGNMSPLLRMKTVSVWSVIHMFFSRFLALGAVCTLISLF